MTEILPPPSNTLLCFSISYSPPTPAFEMSFKLQNIKLYSKERAEKANHWHITQKETCEDKDQKRPKVTKTVIINVHRKLTCPSGQMLMSA